MGVVKAAPEVTVGTVQIVGINQNLEGQEKENNAVCKRNASLYLASLNLQHMLSRQENQLLLQKFQPRNY